MTTRPEKPKSTVHIVDVIPTPVAMYASCARCGEGSPLFANRRDLDRGLPRLGWTSRDLPRPKGQANRADVQWFCPDHKVLEPTNPDGR